LWQAAAFFFFFSVLFSLSSEFAFASYAAN
jgi:Ni/Co efflux regulator RcnB